MYTEFEWDADKAATNLHTHRVSFDDAVNVFADPWALMARDPIEGGERRWRTLGMAGNCLILLVAHTVGEDDEGSAVIGVISARTADRKERKRYEEQTR
jgi:uncharacterized DUF497 family protein